MNAELRDAMLDAADFLASVDATLTSDRADEIASILRREAARDAASGWYTTVHPSLKDMPMPSPGETKITFVRWGDGSNDPDRFHFWLGATDPLQDTGESDFPQVSRARTERK